MDRKKYVSYYRVSTDKQTTSGLGLEAQRAAVDAFLPKDAVMVEEFVETESGKKSDRPQLLMALKVAKAKKAVLLIAKLDRLSRNVAFIANLLESGVDLVALDMPEANKFMLHVMAAVAEQEAHAISERTKAALKAAKNRGVKLGWSNPQRKAEQRLSSKKGAERNRSLADSFAISLFQKSPELFELGTVSPSKLATELNLRGIKSRRGGKWYASSAANLVDRIENAAK